MKKIRYAVVGGGWISQEAFMPGVHETENSVMTALVTGDPARTGGLATYHGIENVFTYDRYDELLAADIVDAVYIALPNSMHADFAIRAAKAGKHVLVEKPLATTIPDSQAMIAAARENGIHLMTAYRLHTDPGNVAVLEMIRRGDIGDPRVFMSSFAFQSDPANHRLKAGHWGGPLQDLGVYCINAVRHIFASEPLEAIATSGSNPGDARFAEVDATVSATLLFPEGRIASFFASFGADAVDTYAVYGTTGRIEVERGFRFETGRKVRLYKDGSVTETEYPNVDDFAGQTAYFSDCILNGTPPEPDGEDGLADMRAMIAIEEAARTGRKQPVGSPARDRHPEPSMVRAIERGTRRLVL